MDNVWQLVFFLTCFVSIFIFLIVRPVTRKLLALWMKKNLDKMNKTSLWERKWFYSRICRRIKRMTFCLEAILGREIYYYLPLYKKVLRRKVL